MARKFYSCVAVWTNPTTGETERKYDDNWVNGWKRGEQLLTEASDINAAREEFTTLESENCDFDHLEGDVIVDERGNRCTIDCREELSFEEKLTGFMFDGTQREKFIEAEYRGWFIACFNGGYYISDQSWSKGEDEDDFDWSSCSIGEFSSVEDAVKEINSMEG